MKIEHLAVWVKDIEAMKTFYTTYFNAEAGAKYHNPDKKFTSYFLRFDSGCRLELMHRPDIRTAWNNNALGMAHFAVSLGSKNAVDQLTQRLKRNGHTIAGEARTTGDGYYESVVLDPEGNQIELTV